MNKRIGFVIVAVAALFVAASCSKPDAVSGATAGSRDRRPRR